MAKSKSKLGDMRLNEVFSNMVDAVSTKFTLVLRQLGEDRKDEVANGRFINNVKVTPQKIIDHYHDTYPFDFSGKHILIAGDTSTNSFKLNANRGLLGFIKSKSTISGFDFHPSIYMDADSGACYGLGGIAVQKADPPDPDADRHDYQKLPFEEKDRYKWYSSFEQATSQISDDAQADTYTIIGDREADIYDLLCRCKTKNWQHVVRSSHDRLLWDIQSNGIKKHANGKNDKLRSTIERWAVEHTYSLKLPKTDKRTAHEAKLDLKFGHVYIARPRTHIDKTLPQYMPVYVVEVKEQAQTVVGKEKPVHWIILTSHPVTNIEQAMQIIEWYRWRWVIEQVFRTLKSKGLDLESSEVESYEGLVNLAVLGLIGAVLILQLVQARDGKTQQKIDELFTDEEQQCLIQLNQKLEGKTKKSKNPHPPHTLAFAVWIIARLGGWKGYRCERPPGPITMLKGLTRFYHIMEGYWLLL